MDRDHHYLRASLFAALAAFQDRSAAVRHLSCGQSADGLSFTARRHGCLLLEGGLTAVRVVFQDLLGVDAIHALTGSGSPHRLLPSLALWLPNLLFGG
jgi:hypothetical protein